MKPNRSIPTATVIPVLIHPDVQEAVAWLAAAFGFVERVRIGETHRAQLRFGEGNGSSRVGQNVQVMTSHGSGSLPPAA
jgi:hypothetical protein